MTRITRIIGSDIPMILAWWGDNEAKPTIDMLPDTTYLITVDGTPIAAASLILTNCRWAAMLEHVIANPAVASGLRSSAIDNLELFIRKEAKLAGYKALTVFSYIDGLKRRYKSMGFTPTRSNITTFSKLL